MPFLAPFIPLIIKGGVALGTSLAASKLAGGGGQPQLNPYESNAMSQLAGISNLTGPYGQQFLSHATAAYGPAQDYWTRILHGDRGAVTQALAPEIESLVGQTNAVRQMQGELQPRGGPGAAYLSQLPYQTAGQIGGLISQARGGAATGLAQLGGEQGRLGLGALSTQQGAASGILNTVLQQKAFDLYRRQQQFDLARQIGKGIYGLLGGIPGAGTPSGNPPSNPQGFPGTGVPDFLGGGLGGLPGGYTG